MCLSSLLEGDKRNYLDKVSYLLPVVLCRIDLNDYSLHLRTLYLHAEVELQSVKYCQKHAQVKIFVRLFQFVLYLATH